MNPEGRSGIAGRYRVHVVTRYAGARRRLSRWVAEEFFQRRGEDVPGHVVVLAVEGAVL